MSYLSDLLGDAYKEGMTEEEISTALQSAGAGAKDNEAEVNRLKAQLSKANSEAADYKKQLRGKQSEDEAAAAEQKATMDKLTQENADLKRSMALSEKKAKLLAMGYDEKLADDTATAMVDTPADKKFTHSLTLQLHDCFPGMQYDAPEALYYCESELKAGVYNFTLLSGYDVNYGGGKTYQFTLTQNVPAGGQITFPWTYNTQASSVKVSTYRNKTDDSLIETATVTEGTEGTSLGTADGKASNMNHSHRIRYGSNNWKESAIRQYLNSEGSSGNVWKPQTKFDRPPSWNKNTAGWMNGLDPDFLAVIGKTKKVTCRNTVTDEGGSDTTTDKFFLLSRQEVFAGKEIGTIEEGKPYPFYSEYSDHETENAGVDKNRIKYRNGSPQWWWLRTPSSGGGNGVRGVNTDGGLGNNVASGGIGVAPACNVI